MTCGLTPEDVRALPWPDVLSLLHDPGDGSGLMDLHTSARILGGLLGGSQRR